METYPNKTDQEKTSTRTGRELNHQYQQLFKLQISMCEKLVKIYFYEACSNRFARISDSKKESKVQFSNCLSPRNSHVHLL